MYGFPVAALAQLFASGFPVAELAQLPEDYVRLSEVVEERDDVEKCSWSCMLSVRYPCKYDVSGMRS